MSCILLLIILQYKTIGFSYMICRILSHCDLSKLVFDFDLLIVKNPHKVIYCYLLTLVLTLVDSCQLAIIPGILIVIYIHIYNKTVSGLCHLLYLNLPNLKCITVKLEDFNISTYFNYQFFLPASSKFIKHIIHSQTKCYFYSYI